MDNFKEKRIELTTKAQVLHDVIERHPYLSGLMSNYMHRALDDLIRNGHLLNEVDSSDFKEKPLEELVKRYLY